MLKCTKCDGNTHEKWGNDATLCYQCYAKLPASERMTNPPKGYEGPATPKWKMDSVVALSVDSRKCEECPHPAEYHYNWSDWCERCLRVEEKRYCEVHGKPQPTAAKCPGCRTSKHPMKWCRECAAEHEEMVAMILKPFESPFAKYREAAVSCGRDGIVVDWTGSFLRISFSRGTNKIVDGVLTIALTLIVDPGESPENYVDAAMRGVAKVHRLRELLRSGGAEI